MAKGLLTAKVKAVRSMQSPQTKTRGAKTAARPKISGPVASASAEPLAQQLVTERRPTANEQAGRTIVQESILDRATEVIGDTDDALRWMGTPIRDLDFATPVSLLSTAEGRQSVLAVLGRLEHGVL